MNDQRFQKLVGTWLVGEVYRRLQLPEGRRTGEAIAVDGAC